MNRTTRSTSIIMTLALLSLLSGCTDAGNNLNRNQTTEQPSQTQNQVSKPESNTQEIKGKEIAPIIVQEQPEFSKNYYKFRNYQINYVPKDSNNTTIAKGELYDIVLKKDNSETVLMKDVSVGVYDDLARIYLTSTPEIIAIRSGFADAGFSTISLHFFNLETGKKITITDNSHDESMKNNSNVTVNNDIYSLLNTKEKLSCKANIEVKNILKNNKPTAELEKAVTIPCVDGETNFGVDLSTKGIDTEMTKIYLVLSHWDDQTAQTVLDENFIINLNDNTITQIPTEDMEKELVGILEN